MTLTNIHHLPSVIKKPTLKITQNGIEPLKYKGVQPKQYATPVALLNLETQNNKILDL